MVCKESQVSMANIIEEMHTSPSALAICDASPFFVFLGESGNPTFSDLQRKTLVERSAVDKLQTVNWQARFVL